MDLKAYYQQIRKVEQSLAAGAVVIVSEETPDGGRAGVKIEVSPHIAAKLIVDQRARLATEVEAREFQAQALEAKQAADQLTAASRMQITVVPAGDFRAGKSPARNTRE